MEKDEIEAIVTAVIEKLEPVINKPEPPKTKAQLKEEIFSIKDNEQRRQAIRDNWELLHETE